MKGKAKKKNIKKEYNMAVGPLHIIIILVIALLVFGGRGKISSIMGDFGKGITSFKKGLKDETDEQSNPVEEALDVTPKKDK